MSPLDSGWGQGRGREQMVEMMELVRVGGNSPRGDKREVAFGDELVEAVGSLEKEVMLVMEHIELDVGDPYVLKEDLVNLILKVACAKADHPVNVS